MTTYQKGEFANASPEFHREVDGAMRAAMRVCEIASCYTDEEIATAICEALIAVAYEHGVLWDSPPDGDIPFNKEAMQDACSVAYEFGKKLEARKIA